MLRPPAWLGDAGLGDAGLGNDGRGRAGFGNGPGPPSAIARVLSPTGAPLGTDGQKKCIQYLLANVVQKCNVEMTRIDVGRNGLPS